MMIEASATSGFPLAVAYCYYAGWNKFKRNYQKVFETCWNFEKSSKGHPWAQYGLGFCYRNGLGTTKNDHKAFAFYTKAGAVAMFSSI